MFKNDCYAVPQPFINCNGRSVYLNTQVIKSNSFQIAKISKELGNPSDLWILNKELEEGSFFPTEIKPALLRADFLGIPVFLN